MAEITTRTVGGKSLEKNKEGVEEKCDIRQAFLAVPSMRVRVGHVQKLKVAKTPITADLALSNPLWANLKEGENRPVYPKVVGVMERAEWPGGLDEPLTVELVVSAVNWQKITHVEHQEDEGSEDDQTYEEAEVTFVVYDFDSVTKRFYKSFHSNDAAIKGKFRFNEKDFSVASAAHEAILSPLVYRLKLVLTPPLSTQSLFIGLAHESQVTKAWGDTSDEALKAAASADEERISRRAAKKKAEEEEKRRKEDEKNADQRAKEEAKRREDEALAAEQKRLAELAQKEKERADQRGALEMAVKAAEARAREAEQAADVEAATAARLEASKRIAEIELVERDRIRARFAEQILGVERERDKSLAEFDKEEKEEREAREKEALEAEQAAWKEELDLGDEVRKLKRLLSDRQLELSHGKPDDPKKIEKAIAALEKQLEKKEALLAAAVEARRQAEGTKKGEAADLEKRRKAAREKRESPFRQKIEELQLARDLEVSTAEKRRESADADAREQQTKLESQKKKREVTETRATSDAEAALLARVDMRSLASEAESARGADEAHSLAEQAALAAERAERHAQAAALELDRQAKKLGRLERELEEARAVADASTQALSRHDFRQDLSVALTLTIDGTATEVSGGAVSRFSVAAETWGYTGEVEFVVALDAGKDELLASFTGTKLIEVELSVKSKFQPESNPPDAFSVKGIALERGVVEDSYDALAQEKVLRRRYRLTFADPAAALWKQHRPTELFNEKKLQDVVDAYKGAKITITGEWAGHWDKVKKFIFLGLGDEANRASFYDLLVWYLDRHRGVLKYDTATNAYAVLATKPADGTATKLHADDVERIEIRFPEVPRHAASVLNAWTEATTKKKEIAFDDAVAGVRRDHLVRTDISAQFDARGVLEAARLVVRKAEVHLLFARFPTVTFAPGVLLDFTSKSWSDDVFSKAKTYRVRTYKVSARSVGSPDRKSEGSAYGLFDVRVEAGLEEKADTVPHLPPYVTPRYPALVEGKVVSEQGAKTDETYQVYTDSTTSIDQYKVAVPLFDLKTVLVDYNPNTLPGHFYFPAFKNARVLLAVEYDRAWIKRFLDWRPGARLPADGQGNHILLGKSDKSQTTINHVYVDEKPVLNVKRLQEKDTQMIQLMEGKLTIEVKEETQ